MQFSVRTADGTVTWDGSYKIDKNGVLRILPEDEGKPMILLSPHTGGSSMSPAPMTPTSRLTRPSFGVPGRLAG
jgi:hypothetical protein